MSAQRSTFRLLTLALWLGLSGCHRHDGTKLPPPTKADVRQAVERLGDGAFTVQWLGIQPGAVRPFENRDFYTVLLNPTHFDARLQFSRDLDVRSREAIRVRVGQPGWTLDEMTRDENLSAILPPGHYAANSQAPAQGYAIFERFGTTWRLRLFDRELQFPTEDFE